MRSQVTTKKGDAGTTRTLGGTVVSKSHPTIECTGALDALRAHTALLRLRIQDQRTAEPALDGFLNWLLHVYFLIGAEVNDPEGLHPEYRRDIVGPTHVERLEREQAVIEAQVRLPKAFIVSASNVLAAEVDLLATTARTFERELVRLKEVVPAFQAAALLAFTNRLSDTLYMLARYLEVGKHIPVDYEVLAPKVDTTGQEGV